MIIKKTVRLVDAPEPVSKGTRIRIRTTAGSLAWGFAGASLADAERPATVDWGDGSAKERFASDMTNVVHEFPAAGEYTVAISDDIGAFTLCGTGSESEFVTVYPAMVLGVVSDGERWATLTQRALKGAANMTEARLYGIAGIAGMPTNRAPFRDCAALTEIHLPAASEESITHSVIWENTSGTLGAPNATVLFDL